MQEFTPAPGTQLFFGGPFDGEWMEVGGYSAAKLLVVEHPQDGPPMTEEIYRRFEGENGEVWRLHIESRPAMRIRVQQR